MVVVMMVVVVPPFAVVIMVRVIMVQPIMPMVIVRLVPTPIIRAVMVRERIRELTLMRILEAESARPQSTSCAGIRHACHTPIRLEVVLLDRGDRPFAPDRVRAVAARVKVVGAVVPPVIVRYRMERADLTGACRADIADCTDRARTSPRRMRTPSSLLRIPRSRIGGYFQQQLDEEDRDEHENEGRHEALLQ